MSPIGDSGMVASRPVWADPEEQSYPHLSASESCEVAIVGAGISGVACARWLVEAGVTDILMLEDRTVASGASGRNAGFVMAVSPENFPRNDDAAEVETARWTWTFTATNQKMIEQSILDFDLDAEYRRNGSMGLAASQSEWDWIKSSAAVAREAGLAVEIVESQDLQPEWVRRIYLGGAWYSGNGEIHPAKFVRGLTRALSRRGVRIYERTRVTKIAQGVGGARYELRAGDTVVRAKYVILATNAYTSTVFPSLSAHIRPTRGQVVATEPIPRRVAEYPVYANNGFQYWRQTSDGRLVVGGWRDLEIETEVGIEETLNPVIQMTLSDVVASLCDYEAALEYRWSGIMGFTSDGRPLVGPIPGCPNMFLSAGFNGHGLAMAFHAASTVVDQIVSGFPCPVVFDPGRFGPLMPQEPATSASHAIERV